ncbi:uncharacterized protein LOC144768316 [Lissotriton helveticus]
MKRVGSASFLLLAAALTLGGLHAARVARLGVARGVTPHGAQGERPGVCPPERKGNLQDQFQDSYCEKDEGCPLAEKCCLDNKDKICKPPAKERPGKCPTVSFKEAAIKNRMDFCSSDSECADSLKCCLTKKGRRCEGSFKAKPGSCPLNEIYCLRAARQACDSDSGCEANLKCCSSKCGRQCVQLR